jgi:hypothetical protein
MAIYKKATTRYGVHTRHLKDDDLLLSTFVHEQMHRFLALRRREDFDQAKTDLRHLFPEIPIGFPQGSSSDEGNYEHLLVAHGLVPTARRR